MPWLLLLFITWNKLDFGCYDREDRSSVYLDKMFNLNHLHSLFKFHVIFTFEAQYLRMCMKNGTFIVCTVNLNYALDIFSYLTWLNTASVFSWKSKLLLLIYFWLSIVNMLMVTNSILFRLNSLRCALYQWPLLWLLDSQCTLLCLLLGSNSSMGKLHLLWYPLRYLL